MRKKRCGLSPPEEKPRRGPLSVLLGQILLHRLGKQIQADKAEHHVDEHEASVVGSGINVGICEGGVEKLRRSGDAERGDAADEVADKAQDTGHNRADIHAALDAVEQGCDAQAAT